MITGLGAVSPYGAGRIAFLEGIRQGRSAVRRISLFDPSALASQVAGEVPDFHPEEILPADDLRRTGRIVPMALLAAREAVEDAGLPLNGDKKVPEGDSRNLGIILGTGAGAIDFAEIQYERYFKDDTRRVSPYAVSSSLVGMVSSELSIALGIKGPSHVVSNGCASSMDAIGYATNAIRFGQADALLAGGADACITPAIMAGFCRMGVVSTHFNEAPERASRPFNLDRDGFVLGEGAWIFVLEELSRAQARGAVVYAEIAGYASTCDAYHRVMVPREGGESARAMRLALEDADLAPGAVDYINLHGTSTQLNDASETVAVKDAFGKRAREIPCSATKSLIGHPQGACGAAGVAATALGIRHGFIPPTANYERPDPACDLDYVPNQTRSGKMTAALCNSLAFGSKNSVLVLKSIS